MTINHSKRFRSLLVIGAGSAYQEKCKVVNQTATTLTSQRDPNSPSTASHINISNASLAILPAPC